MPAAVARKRARADDAGARVPTAADFAHLDAPVPRPRTLAASRVGAPTGAAAEPQQAPPHGASLWDAVVPPLSAIRGQSDAIRAVRAWFAAPCTAALMLAGPSGTGKSAVLRAAAAEAGFRVWDGAACSSDAGKVELKNGKVVSTSTLLAAAYLQVTGGALPSGSGGRAPSKRLVLIEVAEAYTGETRETPKLLELLRAAGSLPNGPHVAVTADTWWGSPMKTLAAACTLVRMAKLGDALVRDIVLAAAKEHVRGGVTVELAERIATAARGSARAALSLLQYRVQTRQRALRIADPLEELGLEFAPFQGGWVVDATERRGVPRGAKLLALNGAPLKGLDEQQLNAALGAALDAAAPAAPATLTLSTIAVPGFQTGDDGLRPPKEDEHGVDRDASVMETVEAALQGRLALRGEHFQTAACELELVLTWLAAAVPTNVAAVSETADMATALAAVATAELLGGYFLRDAAAEVALRSIVSVGMATARTGGFPRMLTWESRRKRARLLRCATASAGFAADDIDDSAVVHRADGKEAVAAEERVQEAAEARNAAKAARKPPTTAQDRAALAASHKLAAARKEMAGKKAGTKAAEAAAGKVARAVSAAAPLLRRELPPGTTLADVRPPPSIAASERLMVVRARAAAVAAALGPRATTAAVNEALRAARVVRADESEADVLDLVRGKVVPFARTPAEDAALRAWAS